MKPNIKINTIGLMSGTSMDGINATLVSTNGETLKRYNINNIFDYNKKTTSLLKIALENPKKYFKNNKFFQRLERMVTIDHYVAIKKLLINTEIKPDLIGFHGQTILHDPANNKTIQVGDGRLLNNLLQIPVVYDFRSNDVFHGGEGAPIAPIYHKHIIENNNLDLPCCIINIGGVANLSYWDGSNLIGFDTGPGNCLMDYFMQKSFKLQFDLNGNIAYKGKSDKAITQKLLNDHYFLKTYPKSLDKSYFHFIFQYCKDMSSENIMATLLDCTLETIINSFNLLPQKPKEIIIAGGGAKNKQLMFKLKYKLKKKLNVRTAEYYGINGEMIEAELIAFLAARKIYNLPITFPNTTGIKEPLSGGKIVK